MRSISVRMSFVASACSASMAAIRSFSCLSALGYHGSLRPLAHSLAELTA